MISIREAFTTAGATSVSQLADFSGEQDPSLRRQAARVAIVHEFQASGGIQGELGIPQTSIEWSDTGAEQTFSGGTIKFLDGVADHVKEWSVNVTYLGSECQYESLIDGTPPSGSDEPYFMLGVIGTPGTRERRFGPYEGIDDGDTMVDVTKLCEDFIPPITIGVVAMEHDEGNILRAQAEVAEAIERVGDAMNGAAAAFTGTSPHGWIVDERLELFGWPVEAFGAVWGLGDDYVGSDAAFLFDFDKERKQWWGLPKLGTFEGHDYNASLRADGGIDEGQYNFYFDVELRRNGELVGPKPG